MAYELPEPAKKLKPATWKTSCTAGMVLAILSTFAVMAVVRCKPEAGGKLTLVIITPWSSLGTKLDAVVFTRITRVVAKMAMPASTIHFFLPGNLPIFHIYF